MQKVYVGGHRRFSLSKCFFFVRLKNQCVVAVAIKKKKDTQAFDVGMAPEDGDNFA